MDLFRNFGLCAIGRAHPHEGSGCGRLPSRNLFLPCEFDFVCRSQVAGGLVPPRCLTRAPFYNRSRRGIRLRSSPGIPPPCSPFKKEGPAGALRSKPGSARRSYSGGTDLLYEITPPAEAPACRLSGHQPKQRAASKSWPCFSIIKMARASLAATALMAFTRRCVRLKILS